MKRAVRLDGIINVTVRVRKTVCQYRHNSIENGHVLSSLSEEVRRIHPVSVFIIARSEHIFNSLVQFLSKNVRK